MTSTTSIAEALRQWRAWWWLALRDIRSRYRGSVLGPLWLLVTLAILVGGLSLVYGAIFNQPLKTFIPYLTAGFMAWWFVSVSITECCTAFIANSNLIRNQPQPIAIYVLQALARNAAILATNLVVFLVVALICGLLPSPAHLLLLPGFMLVGALLFRLDPNILIFDEWLSVADAGFKQRAETMMKNLVERSRILVIASHNTDLLARLCNRGILLKAGGVAAAGTMDNAISAYLGKSPDVTAARPACQTSPQNA